MAEEIANGWARVFAEESGRLASKGKAGTLKFIEKEFPLGKQRLMEVESVLRKTQDRHDRKINESEDLLDEKIAAFKSEWDLALLGEKVEASRRELTFLTSQLSDTQLETHSVGDRLKELKKVIKEHPQFIVVSKAISDDALLEKIGSDYEVAKQLEEVKLKTEKLNSVHLILLLNIPHINFGRTFSSLPSE